MILGSPAQMAGMEQGDQLLQIDEQLVNGQSPFQAASAISGGDREPDTIVEPTVLLQVSTHILLWRMSCMCKLVLLQLSASMRLLLLLHLLSSCSSALGFETLCLPWMTAMSLWHTS